MVFVVEHWSTNILTINEDIRGRGMRNTCMNATVNVTSGEPCALSYSYNTGTRDAWHILH